MKHTSVKQAFGATTLAASSSALIASLQALFLSHVLAASKPFKIMPNAATFERFGTFVPPAAAVLAIGVALVAARQSPWLTPPLAFLIVPAAALLLFRIVFGLHPKASELAPDFSDLAALQEFVMTIWWVTIGGCAV